MNASGDGIYDLYVGIIHSLNVQCVHAFSIDKAIFWLSWHFDCYVCSVDASFFPFYVIYGALFLLSILYHSLLPSSICYCI